MLHFMQVPLGVILKSEQKLEDIMDDLQQYVPVVTSEHEYVLPGVSEPN